MPAQGFTPAEIIELAMKRTERRGKTLDLKKELVIVAQEFCQERRWHWRKKSTAFNTAAGTEIYDLADQAGMAGLTCERVCKEGPKIFRTASDYVAMSAIFETDLQEIARENDGQDTPAQYFMDGQDQFRPVPVPNGIYKIRIPMWVLPDDSAMEEAITLVPAHLHHIVLKGLEARIFRFTLGEGSTKYTAAVAEYEKAVFKAGLSTDFAEGRVREWKSDEEAIRSS
jgi:hypothetical protein